MRATSAGLVLLAVVRQASGAACPVEPPTGAWPQGAARKAVHAGRVHDNINVPDKWDGFNRSVSIDGLCLDSFTASSSYSCSGGVGGEFSAAAKVPTNVTLRFGAASCPLTAMSIYKTPKGTFEAEMRLQFDGCVAAPVASAAVVVGIRKDKEADFNLLPWTEDVCKSETTTWAPPASISTETNAKMLLVGQGNCDATELKSIKNIATTEDCKLQCISETSQAALLDTAPCTGFTYNNQVSSEANCITFKGKVTKATDKAGWTCYNMTTEETQYAKSTPAPVLGPKDTTQMLDMNKVLTSSPALLEEILPPAAEPTCFKSMWWFTLQDRMGNPRSLPVKLADWDAFMAKLPEPMTTKSVVDTASMVMDRILVNTCVAGTGWDETTCFVPPVEQDNTCRNEEVTAAVVAGVFTSFCTWILVGIIFWMYKSALQHREYQPLQEPGEKGRFCQSQLLFGLTVVAACGATLFAWVSMQFLDALMGSSGCFDMTEFTLIVIAVGLAAGLAIILFLWFVARAHPSHPHPLIADKPKEAKQPSTLMLVEVPHGGSTATPLASKWHNTSPGGSGNFASGSGNPLMSTKNANATGH